MTVYNFLHFEEVQWGELHAAGTLVSSRYAVQIRPDPVSPDRWALEVEG